MLSGIIYIQFIFTLAFRSGAWYNICVTIFRAQSETKAIFVYMRRKDTMARVVGISAAVMLIIAAAAVAVPAYILSRDEPETPGLTITPGAAEGQLSPAVPSEEQETEPPPEHIITEISLSFVGDCMLATDGGYEYEGSFNKLANEVDPSYFFEDFQDIFANDDWTIANLENVFTDDPNIQRKGKNHSPAYWYKSKTANTDILNAGSIEVVSLANNHSGDYGTKGNQDTKDALDKAGVIWGDDDKIVTLEKEGFRIAIYCCTFYYGGYEKIIMDNLMAVDADYRIVYFHGGTERVHVPDGWKAAGARRMIDSGADLVIGGHPHVLQPIEEYNGKKILHSLGNFCFGGSRSEENRTIVYRLWLTLTDGELTETRDEVVPCYLYSTLYKPTPITDKKDYDAVMAFLNGETESPLG